MSVILNKKIYTYLDDRYKSDLFSIACIILPIARNITYVYSVFVFFSIITIKYAIFFLFQKKSV